MTSLYRVNYQLRAHKRDPLIEFMKAMLLTPFVLHSPNTTHTTTNTTTTNTTNTTPHSTNTASTMSTIVQSTNESEHDSAQADYAEILSRLELLIEHHRRMEQQGSPHLSQLYRLVPSIGSFFTPLPLKQAFLIQDARVKLSARRFVPPSFNDIRRILNTAQIMAIQKQLQLITFDGDMTLYADGASFTHDAYLVQLLTTLLQHDLFVAIVTAAAYGPSPFAYERRLSGLLDGFRAAHLTPQQLSRFYVLGGECNYLFQCSEQARLVYINAMQVKGLPEWNEDQVGRVLDTAQHALQQCLHRMNLKARILRKQKAVGLIPLPGATLQREQLDECVLTVQQRVNEVNAGKRVHVSSPSIPTFTSEQGVDPTAPHDLFQDHVVLQKNHGCTDQQEPGLPFCAFNGGSDVWVDVGNKLIGVHVLQHHLGTLPETTLHVGDQFLSTGNDFATRSACCTLWIVNPEETASALQELIQQLDEGKESEENQETSEEA